MFNYISTTEIDGLVQSHPALGSDPPDFMAIVDRHEFLESRNRWVFWVRLMKGSKGRDGQALVVIDSPRIRLDVIGMTLVDPSIESSAYRIRMFVTPGEWSRNDMENAVLVPLEWASLHLPTPQPTNVLGA